MLCYTLYNLICVSTMVGDSVIVTHVSYLSYFVYKISDMGRFNNFYLADLDISLVMTWFSPHYDVLNFNVMFVTIEISGREKFNVGRAS